MEISIRLAQIFGIVFLAIGLGMLFEPKYYHKIYNDFVKNPALIYVTALAITAVGYFIIVKHNVWIMSWEVIITIIGWLALIKGILLLVIPQGFLNMSKGWFKKPEIFSKYAIIVLILGGILSYYGFLA